MIKVTYFIGFMLIVFSLDSCKEKESHDVGDVPQKEIELLLRPTFGSQHIVLDSVYMLNDGTLVKLTDFKVYFSHIIANGTELSAVSLYNFTENGTSIFRGVKNESNASSITFSLGVLPSLNHNDPSTFPSNHPLSILVANDMHWDWNPGYIFYKIEGKADTLVDGTTNLNHSFSFHIGMDQNLTSKTISGLSWSNATENLEQAWLKWDMQQFFDNPAQPLDLKTIYTSHSMPGEEASTNLVKSNFLESISAL